MIVKIITVVYAWVWNVAPWTPKKSEDWLLVMLMSIFADPFAIIGIGFIVSAIIKKVKGGAK